jgi:hypothetical protein
MTTRRAPAAISSCINTMKIPSVLKTIGVLFILILSTMPGAAAVAGPDEEYLAIYFNIEKADALNASGKQEQARAKYEEAQKALKLYQKNFPTSNVKSVNYRVGYVASKLASFAPMDPKPAVAASKPASTTPARSAQAGTTQRDSVHLVSAGSEPRKALRFRGTAGMQQTMTMIMTMGMEMKMGDVPSQAMQMPPMTMAMDMTIKNVASNGDISYDGVIREVSVAEGDNPMIATAMKASVEGLKGLTISAVMTPRGQNRNISTKSSGAVNPQAQQTIEQIKESFTTFQMPFPDEPVGAGARWEVKGPLKSQGMTVNQTAVYEMTSVEGDVVKLKSSVTQQAANQKIQNPAMPGIVVDVPSMTGNANGDVTLNLSRPLASDANINMRSDTIMNMDMGGQKQTMGMKMNMNMEMKSN